MWFSKKAYFWFQACRVMDIAAGAYHSVFISPENVTCSLLTRLLITANDCRFRFTYAVRTQIIVLVLKMVKDHILCKKSSASRCMRIDCEIYLLLRNHQSLYPTSVHQYVLHYYTRGQEDMRCWKGSDQTSQTFTLLCEKTCKSLVLEPSLCEYNSQ